MGGAARYAELVKSVNLFVNLRRSIPTACVEDFVTEDLVQPTAMVLDLCDERIYWTEYSGHRLKRARLDGSDVETIVTTAEEYPSRIALDVTGGKVYWTSPSEEKILRANLDGSNIEEIITTGLNYPWGLAFHHPSPGGC